MRAVSARSVCHLVARITAAVSAGKIAPAGVWIGIALIAMLISNIPVTDCSQPDANAARAHATDQKACDEKTIHGSAISG